MWTIIASVIRSTSNKIYKSVDHLRMWRTPTCTWYLQNILLYLDHPNCMTKFNYQSAIIFKVGKSLICNIRWYMERWDIRTFFVTQLQDREKSTDPVEGGAAQESIDSVEGEESTVSVKRLTTHVVSSSSWCSGSTLHEWYFSQWYDLLPPSSLLLSVHTYGAVPVLLLGALVF